MHWEARGPFLGQGALEGGCGKPLECVGPGLFVWRGHGGGWRFGLTAQSCLALVWLKCRGRRAEALRRLVPTVPRPGPGRWARS